MRSHSIVLVTWSTNGRQNVIQKPGKRSDSEYRHVLCMTGVCWVAWWCHDCNWKYINPQIQDPNTCYSIFTGKSTGLFPQHLAWIKVSLRKGKHGTSLHDYLFFHILKQGELPLSQLLAFIVGNIFLKFWHHMNAQQAQSHKAASMGLDPTLFCFVLLEKKNISRPHQSTTAWTCRLRDSLSRNWWGRMMLWQRCVTVSVL